MLRIGITVTLMLIASALCVKSLSCDSCGSECAPACGTRRFRSCCFNYLRKKRQDHGMDIMDFKTENIRQPKHKVIVLDDFPDPWSNVVFNDVKLYPREDMMAY